MSATPTPPIAFPHPDAVKGRWPAPAALSPAFLERLGRIVPVATDAAALAEASRDWWPLAMIWALDDEVPGVAGAIARPTTAGQVAAVLDLCDASHVPVTPAGGRSGVCGASVPVFGGVALDLTGLRGIVAVDDRS